MSLSLTGEGVVPKPTWEHGNGQQIRHKLSDSAIVIRLAVSSKYIILSLSDKTIRVFSAAGQPLTIFRDQDADVWSLALQDDVLLTGEMSGNIRCWDLIECHQMRSLKGHTKTVRCIDFFDTTTAVSASRDGDLRIWNFRTGMCESTLSSQQDTIYDLAITSKHAISGSKDCTAKVWSLSERRELWTLSGHSEAVWCVATDGEKVITGSLDSDIRVWEVATGNPVAVLEGHTGSVDGKIIVWSLRDHAVRHTIMKAHEGAVSSLDICGEHIISGGSDGRVKLWHSQTAEYLGDVGPQNQAVWGMSLGRVKDQITVIMATAQATSLPPEHDGASLDVSVLFTH